MENMLIYNGKDSKLPLPDTPKILSDEGIASGNYVKLRKIEFLEKGDRKIWEIANSHDSVSILIYDKERDGFIFVRQFRVSVFMRGGSGYMYELCAGLCDKQKLPIEIAKDEIEEECGYRVELDSIRRINEFYSSVGMNGAKQNLFYVEVDSSKRCSSGGGRADEAEHIESVFVSRALIDEFLHDENCPKVQSLGYAILWWKMNIGIYKS